MKKILLEDIKIIETIEEIPENSFTILDFMKTFKKLFFEKSGVNLSADLVFLEKRKDIQ